MTLYNEEKVLQFKTINMIKMQLTLLESNGYMQYMHVHPTSAYLNTNINKYVHVHQDFCMLKREFFFFFYKFTFDKP